MGFSRQECCSGLPFSTPGALPHPGDFRERNKRMAIEILFEKEARISVFKQVLVFLGTVIPEHSRVVGTTLDRT